MELCWANSIHFAPELVHPIWLCVCVCPGVLNLHYYLWVSLVIVYRGWVRL
jgi:hypothetical protein